MRIWLLAARPRTLPAAVAPVLVGTAYAVGLTDDVRWGAFIAAMLGAIFIQIGTNLSNDYSDARRGADTEERLGPVRVTAGGLVPPKSVLRATYIAFACAVLCGVYLIAIAGWVVLAIGSASIIAGVLYTGGPKPYGYEGLGEVFVFLFFGVVAVSGSAYVQIEEFTWEALALSVPVGFLATAILVVNNVRDISTDARAGKRTLAVRIGRERTRIVFAVLVYGSFLALIPIAASITGYALIAALAIMPAVIVVRKVRNHSDGPTLNEALANTGVLQLLFCVLLSAGLILA